MSYTKRLIDVEQAKRATYEEIFWSESEQAVVRHFLAKLPKVDAVEVVHAEWACVNESENVWMCTGKNGCGNEVLLLEGTPSENGWYYCPNCGAKMDGGNEDV